LILTTGCWPRAGVTVFSDLPSLRLFRLAQARLDGGGAFRTFILRPTAMS